MVEVEGQENGRRHSARRDPGLRPAHAEHFHMLSPEFVLQNAPSPLAHKMSHSRNCQHLESIHQLASTDRHSPTRCLLSKTVSNRSRVDSSPGQQGSPLAHEMPTQQKLSAIHPCRVESSAGQQPRSPTRCLLAKNSPTMNSIRMELTRQRRICLLFIGPCGVVGLFEAYVAGSIPGEVIAVFFLLIAPPV